MEINNLLLHPALDTLQPNIIEEVLLSVPLFHGGAGFIGVAPAASRNKVVPVAGARLKAGDNVIQGSGRFVAVTALAVPGVVNRLSETSFC